MSGRFWLISILTLVVMLLVGFRVILPKTGGKKTVDEWLPMKVGDTTIQVLIADDPMETEIGLGGRETLGDDEGMLFVYPQLVTPRYWMKGMRFDLDFIWIAKGRVVDITTDVPAPIQKNATLPFYVPKEPVDSVLEVQAGWVNTHGIKVADLVTQPAWPLQK